MPSCVTYPSFVVTRLGHGGATVTLAGREAYQVYAYFPDDGTFLVTWCVADDAGVVHYVAAEGPSDGLMDLVTLVEQSYSFTEQ